MKARTLLTLALAILATTTLPAQTELPDSVAVPRTGTPPPAATVPGTPGMTTAPAAPSEAEGTAYDRRTPTGQALPPVNAAALTYPSFRFTPGVAPIYSWGSGSIYAAGGRTSMPGLMGLEQGSLNLQQNFGSLSIGLYAGASKYGYFRGLDTSWNFGADATYRFNDKLSLTVFGGYATSGGLPQPAIAGFYDVPSIGAFLDYRFAEKWGVRMGVHSERSMLTGRWETRPMVEPYFMLFGQPLGIDVGGILYELLRSKNDWGPHNPTIAPPVQKLSDTFH